MGKVSPSNGKQFDRDEGQKDVSKKLSYLTVFLYPGDNNTSTARQTVLVFVVPSRAIRTTISVCPLVLPLLALFP